MKPLLIASAFVSVLSLAPFARAEPVELLQKPAAPMSPPDADRHPLPRLKLSYVRFEAGHPSGGAIPLQALHLDMYALSWRWLRLGVDVEAGTGQTKLAGAATSLRYGLLGLSGGLQLPGRITPFIEGRLAAGVMGGTATDPVTIPGTTIDATGVSAATWMVARGLDVGAEVYTFGRAYVSAGVGWVRTTWRGADYTAGTGLTFKDVNHDSFLLKLGLGI